MKLDVVLLSTLLCTSVAGLTIASTEAMACQPEPATGYVTSTIPADGGKTGTTHHALELFPPIALRWSNVDSSGDLGMFYSFLHGGSGQGIPIDEPVVSSFVVVEENTGNQPIPGQLVQGAQEARFVPERGALSSSSKYTATVTFLDGDSYSWSFETTEDPSYMDMPFPFGGIENTTLREKAYPTYTYCDIDFDDPEFTCYPDRRQSGWNYRPALYIEFDAQTSAEHGPMLYRYALYVHDSARDSEGELVRYVDVQNSGSQTIEIESPKKSGDSYCYSLDYLYAYSHDAQSFGRSEIVCHPASDLIAAPRMPVPDSEPLSCEQGNTGGGGDDMGGSGGRVDMGGGEQGADMGQTMSESERGTSGWKLEEGEQDDSLDDEGCGCASSPGGAPEPGNMMLLGLGLVAGVARRRRT